MKTSYVSISRLMLLCVVGASCTLTLGCKSTSWKMPGANWFSWNRQPSAETLAGGAGGVELPVSPASKYDPTSVAASGSTAPSSYGYTANTAAQATSAGSMGAPVIQGTAAGLAATANGYQTGPYGVSSTASTLPAAVTSAAGPSQGFPNPYGGTYAGGAKMTYPASSTSLPDITLPTSVSNALAAAANAPVTTSMPNLAVGSASLPGNIPVGYPSMPSTLSLPTAVAPSSATTSIPTYPGLPSASQPSASQPSASQPSESQPNASQPGAYNSKAAATQTAGSAANVASSAYSGNADLSGVSTYSGFAPGTTARSTTYDFSTSGLSSSTKPTTTFTLPPNSAAGSGPGIVTPTNSNPLLR